MKYEMSSSFRRSPCCEMRCGGEGLPGDRDLAFKFFLGLRVHVDIGLGVGSIFTRLYE